MIKLRNVKYWPIKSAVLLLRVPTCYVKWEWMFLDWVYRVCVDVPTNVHANLLNAVCVPIVVGSFLRH